MRPLGYRRAVEWIAENDAPADAENINCLAGYLTTLLVADLYGKDPATVASDVYAYRHPKQQETRP